MKGHRIITAFDSTPNCWVAIFDGYDGAPDAKPPSSLVGYGKSELSAVEDLLEQSDACRGDEERLA